jgi:phytoene dehydrogenase-like protein
MAVEQHDVVVVGAGLAGLCAALHLVTAGLDVVVHEAAPHVGGRVATDEVDGFLLDRGFQLHNPAYPEARRMLDHEALELQTFRAGVVVAHGGRRHRVGDPRREPGWVLSSLTAPVGTPNAKARLAALAVGNAVRRPATLIDAPDLSAAEHFTRLGIRGPVLDRLLRPFLAGVLGEADLATSRRFVDLVLRSFVLGTPAVPRDGMRAIPEQLAARLPAGVVRCSSAVRRVRAGEVSLDDRTLRARAVVVATDAAAAGTLLPWVTVPDPNALTTVYHAVDGTPAEVGLPSEPVLHVDGDGRGPVVNTCVISAVNPRYAPAGSTLISSTVLGDVPDAERTVRKHCRVIYGVDTAQWRHVRTYALPQALPRMLPPLDLRRPVVVGDGLFVCGDHRDTSSIQGAMVSGRRAASAVLRNLRS